MEEDCLQLLHNWLNCNEEAGRSLWFGKGLFFEYQQRAIRIGNQHLRKLRTCGRQIYVSHHDMEGYSAEQLIEIYNGLKPIAAEKPGKTPDNFPNINMFHGFLMKRILGIIDIINDTAGLSSKLISLNSPVSIDKDSEEEKTIEDMLDPMLPTPLDNAIVKHQQAIAAVLIQDFKKRLISKPALQHHLILLIEFHTGNRSDINLEDVVIEIISFFEIPKEHYPDVSEFFKAKGTNENTYNAYNRRLRHEWRQFREESGKILWENLKETLL